MRLSGYYMLDKFINYSILAVLALFPLALNFSIISPPDTTHPIFSVNFSIADLLIIFAFALWVLRSILLKTWRDINPPVKPVILLIFAGFISFVNAFSLSGWLKELVQLIEYFLLFYLLLENNNKKINLTIVKKILFVVASINLLIALIQHWILKGDVYYIRGLFENRNVFGSYLCMVIPLGYVELIESKVIAKKIWMVVLLMLTYWVLVSISSLLSIAISILFISFFLGRRYFLFSIFSILFLTLAYPHITSNKNFEEVKYFFRFQEQGSINQKYYKKLSILNLDNYKAFYRKDLKNGNYILISGNNYLDVKLPETIPGDRYSDLDSTKQIKNRYVEMQAALNLIGKNFLFGVGLGNYQNNIGSYFIELPKVNTSEPNQNNTYLLLGVTMGVFGFIVYLWLLGKSFNSALNRFILNKEGEEKFFFLGLSGSIIAIVIEGFFSYLFVSSLLVPFVFLIYCSNKKM